MLRPQDNFHETDLVSVLEELDVLRFWYLQRHRDIVKEENEGKVLNFASRPETSLSQFGIGYPWG